MNHINYTYCPCCDAGKISPKLTAKDYTVTGESFEVWQCNSCGVRFTQNTPDKSSITKYYLSENYISHTDTKKGIINSLYHLIRKRTLHQKKTLIERITAVQKGNILDIGAGTGAFLSYMKSKGWDTVGLEPDGSARKRASDLYGLNLQPADAFFALPHDRFDAVTMWHVLEHVHALHDYLEQVKNVLKPSGKAFIAVPNFNAYDAEVYKEYWAAYDVPRHLYHFNPFSMKLLVKKHGMVLRDTKPMWYDSFYVSMLSERYKSGSSNYLKALTTGLKSNLRTSMDPEKCSSLIYIIEKSV